MDVKPEICFDANSLKSAFCRFCARNLFLNDLINYQSELAAEVHLALKLCKIRVLICDNDGLPNNICRECLAELDRVVNFLEKIEQSQKALELIFSDVKPTLDDQNDSYDDIKTELETSVHMEHVSKTIEERLVNETNKTSKIEDNKKAIVEDEADIDSSKDINWDLSIESDANFEEEDNEPLTNVKKSHTLPYDCETNTITSIKTWDKYPWVCSTCNQQQESLKSLKEHTKSMHGACCTFKCVDCIIKRFVNHQTFIKHVGEHRTHLKKCCFECGKILKTKWKLKEHVIESHIHEHVCRVCGDIFPDTTSLKNHIEKYGKFFKPRRLTPQDLMCKYCGKSCKNSSNLKVHVSTHEERTRDHTCHLCGKAFYNKGTLISHLDAHANKRPFQCHLCDKKFQTKNKLNRHIETHSDFKSVACETCGRMFRNKYQLKYHQIVHTDEMPFACSFCDKRFKFKSVWKTHQNQHTGNRPYECVECSHSFTNQSNYAKHMLRRHGVKIGSRRNNIKKDPNTSDSVAIIGMDHPT